MSLKWLLFLKNGAKRERWNKRKGLDDETG